MLVHKFYIILISGPDIFLEKYLNHDVFANPTFTETTVCPI